MDISFQVHIDQNVSVKYEPALFDLRFVERKNNHVTFKLNRNHLSELIAVGMGCTIQLEHNQKEIPGNITRVEKSNGEVTVICRVAVTNKEIIKDFS
jgi:hypothetical protein